MFSLSVSDVTIRTCAINVFCSIHVHVREYFIYMQMHCSMHMYVYAYIVCLSKYILNDHIIIYIYIYWYILTCCIYTLLFVIFLQFKGSLVVSPIITPRQMVVGTFSIDTLTEGDECTNVAFRTHEINFHQVQYSITYAHVHIHVYMVY